MTDLFEQDYNPIYNPYYQLDDGRVYDKDKQVFVTAEGDEDYKAFVDAGNEPLCIGEGYSVEQLKRSVLKFYGWPIGECLLTLEELKERKLTELKEKSAAFEDNLNTDMMIQSSIGYPMNADRRSQQNIQGQLTIMQARTLSTIPYRCGDNVTRDLTAEQLQTVYGEQLANGASLYNQKWAMEDAINNAQSLDELKKIEVKFTMMDFTTKDGE